jgi:hypothetical protein
VLCPAAQLLANALKLANTLKSFQMHPPADELPGTAAD